MKMVESTHIADFWPHLYSPFRRLGERIADWVAPASDAFSDDETYHVSIELPGVKDEDVEITMVDGVLTVAGKKSASRQEQGETWYVTERQYGQFRRTFQLPGDADEDQVSAKMKDGILTVAIGRKAETATKGKTITVEKG